MPVFVNYLLYKFNKWSLQMQQITCNITTEQAKAC